ncbi:ARABIDOPSIS DEHISCENCE ZONE POLYGALACTURONASE 2, polygalacturonase abscission zone A. thaliana [Hibiscus trionum]|uniref:endo-polygalacturonase n=1 Tax=Hibiscus trionum TaxID=183268 RepID=A0A9W7HMN7_HIBTR|nr:ARABIDOPSIS DEHISCENCE ZONE POLYGALACTURONASE 2, polygalacturonase abscission zone A. thaliana [Hibiscus trionum]
MAAQITQLLALFLALFSLFSRYNALKDDLNHYSYNNYFEEEMGAGYDPRAYPSYYGAIGGYGNVDGSMTALSFRRYSVASASTGTVVNVDDFGATGDKTHDTEAFEKAWKKACSSKGGVVLLVPQGKNYVLKPVRFTGPCKSNLTMQIYGNIAASDDRSDYEEDNRHWLVFDKVDNFLVEGGGGKINGNGKIWWQNSCKINKNLPCKGAPTAITFYKNKNLVVRNLTIQNAQQIHVSFQRCTGVRASGFKITSPEKSPNTDGIHITNTQNIRVTSSVIGTGDDCISIVSGSQDVEATDITCGPGHGISIGSLGSKNSKAFVSGVTVDGAKLSGTTNGVRIKTWQGGSGTASNITFKNIEMNNVKNPIIIDQNYCDQSKPCEEQSSAVQVKNVVYSNIKGTSSSKVAINFDCSKNHPCQGIVLQKVNLQDQDHGPAKAVCNNVKLREEDTVPKCP